MITDSPEGPPAPTGTEARVCRDIAQRQQRGIAKYGTTVEENPLRLLEWLHHAYEEALDLAVYLRRAIDKLKSELPNHPSTITMEFKDRIKGMSLESLCALNLQNRRQMDLPMVEAELASRLIQSGHLLCQQGKLVLQRNLPNHPNS